MIVNNEFEIGQEVYLKTDEDQSKRIVTGIIVRQSGVLYYVSFDTNESVHYGFEMSNSVDINMKLNITRNEED